MIVEYLPNSVLPILFPILIPKEIEISENTPIEMEVKKGENPVMPAPKPIAKQFKASKKPKKEDSFNVIICSFSTLRIAGRPSSFCIDLFLTHTGDGIINHMPRAVIRKPPVKLAMDCEK